MGAEVDKERYSGKRFLIAVNKSTKTVNATKKCYGFQQT